jgi:hypothetical protein
MLCRVSCGEIRSRNEVNWLKTTDFVFRGRDWRCVRRLPILADVDALGDRGWRRRRVIRGGGDVCLEPEYKSSSESSEAGDPGGESFECLTTSKTSRGLRFPRHEKQRGISPLSV